MKHAITVWAAAAAMVCTAAASASAAGARAEPAPGPSTVSANDSTDAASNITRGTVLANATVVDTRDGTLQRGMSVVVDGGKIVRIAPAAAIRAGGDARLVDAGGKYLIPGLLDMHTHMMPIAARQPANWPLLVAFGVTGIREMGGSPELLQLAKKLNAARAAGTLAAPEILQTPGTILVAVGVPLGGKAPPAAADLVAQQQAMGAQFIKLASGTRNGTLAVLAEARKAGLDVAGHIPAGLNQGEASDAGWKSTEHLGAGFGVLLDCSRQENEVRAALLSGGGAPPVMSPLAIVSPNLFRQADTPLLQRVHASYSAPQCAALAGKLARNATWQVPTLIRLRTAAYGEGDGYRAAPAMQYVDKATRALWEQAGAQFSRQVTPAGSAVFRQYYERQKEVVRLYSQSGVKLLAGSDVGGIWVVPGASLHQEFGELAAAGVPPLQILQMATLNGAQFLRREASMGTVEAGKNADLVLLEANPVDDAANLSKIAGVMLNGRYMDQAELNRMKADAAGAVERQPLESAPPALDPAHVH